MIQISSDEDNFVSDFRTLQGRREDLVSILVSSTNRLTLNIPGRGMARRIAALLREGPFTDYYEFEKLLARALHPFLAGLNLNVIADVRINRLFTEKYHFYARDINYILASNKKLGPDALKVVILKMVERDGHYMVVKFYDLVLRLINTHLYRELKQSELCLIEMKRNLGGSTEESTVAIKAIYDAYKKDHGDTAALLLSRRVQWDQELKNYLQSENEPVFTGITEDAVSDIASKDETASSGGDREIESGTGPHEEGGEHGEAIPWHDRVARYASLIKENYLMMKEPSDEQGIRSIVEGMSVKNERVSGPERAADIVREVLTLWIEDDTLDDIMRDVLSRMRDERQGLADFQDELAQEEIPQEALSQETPPQGALAMEEGEPMADEIGETVAGAVKEERVAEALQGEEESKPLEAGVSDEEMSSILAEIPDEAPEQDNQSEEAAGREAPLQGGTEQGDDEAFLISEDELHQTEEGTSQPEAGTDDSFLIGEEEIADDVLGQVQDEAPDKVSADQDFIEEMMAADEFAIQDELLYEDKSLKKKQKIEKKPDDV